MAAKHWNLFAQDPFSDELTLRLGSLARRGFIAKASCGFAFLTLSPLFALADTVYAPMQKIYVGTGAKNDGVATTNPTHMNDTTQPWGYTIDYSSAQPADKFVEVFVGVGAKNKAVVSRDANYNYDATESIGMFALAPLFPGAKKLYVGTGTLNDGVVTPNQMHLGDSTDFFGFALPL